MLLHQALDQIRESGVLAGSDDGNITADLTVPDDSDARLELEARSKSELVDLLLAARHADAVNQGKVEKERQQLQSRLEEAVEAINDAFVLYDVDGNLVLANTRFKEFYPFNADLLVPGISFETLFRNEVANGLHPGKTLEDSDFINQRVADFFEARMTATRRHSGGRWMLVTDRKTPAGEIVGLRTDVTELKLREEEAKLAEEAAHQAWQEAEAANKSKTEFLGNMSHELRTPLNAVIGFSSILAGQIYGPLENEKYLDYAGDIQRSGEHLLKMINDLLDISRIEAGEVVIDPVALSVADSAERCFAMVSSQAEAAGLILQTNIP